MRAQTYWWTVIINQKLGQYDLVYRAYRSCFLPTECYWTVSASRYFRCIFKTELQLLLLLLLLLLLPGGRDPRSYKQSQTPFTGNQYVRVVRSSQKSLAVKNFSYPLSGEIIVKIDKDLTKLPWWDKCDTLLLHLRASSVCFVQWTAAVTSAPAECWATTVSGLTPWLLLMRRR